MYVNDALSDMIARIKNAQSVSLDITKVVNSKLNANVLNVLKDEGFIADYKQSEQDNKFIDVALKYDAGKPIISEFKRVSKPGRRVYSKIADLPKYFNGLGVAIVSTPKGVVADHVAREHKVGGEILCVIF